MAKEISPFAPTERKWTMRGPRIGAILRLGQPVYLKTKTEGGKNGRAKRTLS